MDENIKFVDETKILSEIVKVLQIRKVCKNDSELLKSLNISKQTLKQYLKTLTKTENPRFKVVKSGKKHFKLIRILNSFNHKFGENRQVVTLKTDLKTAIYFHKGATKFFKSQQFIKECGDGGIQFEISYNQPDEVLPFIQSWLPHLNIVEPLSLRNLMFNNISKTIKVERIIQNFEEFNLKARKKIEKYVSAVLEKKSNFMGGIGNQIELIGLEKDKLAEFKNLIHELNLGLHYNPDEKIKKDGAEYRIKVEQLLEYLETYVIDKIKQSEQKSIITDLEKRVLYLENSVNSKIKVITKQSQVPKNINTEISKLRADLVKRQIANQNRLMTISRLEANLITSTDINKKAVLRKQIQSTKSNIVDTSDIEKKIKELS